MNQKQDSDSSSSQQQFQQQNSLPKTKDEPQVTAQKILLEQFEKQQRDAGKGSILSQDVEFKLDQILQDIKEEDTGDFQATISLRMKELAYSKILVLTYEKSFFRLVQAHFHIGKEYLRFKCYDQALFHLQSALNKNIKAGTSPTNKFYHSLMLSYHGETLLALKKFKEAEEQLQKAINLQQEYETNSKQPVNNVRTLTMFALVKSQQDIAQGKRLIQNAIKKAKIVLGQNTKIYSLALCDQAKILSRTSDKTLIPAIYKQAIKCLQMSNQSEWQQQVMKIYDELASISKELSQNDEWINALKSKYQIMEETYGNADKRTIKQQRTLASGLLSLQRIDQSLDQFDDILEKQQKVYGENSIEVGKQYKTIGNIYTLRNDTKNADKNFKKALKIFHDLGQQRLAKQVKLKISLATYM